MHPDAFLCLRMTATIILAQHGTTRQPPSHVLCVQELYGDETAAALTGAFGRLFTAYLQLRGFTCGIDDLLLHRPSEMERLQLLGRAETAALQASAKIAGDEDNQTVSPTATKRLWFRAALV